MAENYHKSKLKRKKPSVEESHTGTTPRKNLSTADRPVVPAASWWNREQLPAVENLWVLTLKSALPYLENQHWDLVPDLPRPSARRPTALTPDEQQWCGLSDEVAPLPEPAPPSPRTWLRSEPVSAHRELSAQTKPAAEAPDRQQPPRSRRQQQQQHHDGGATTSRQCLAKKAWLSPHGGGEAAPSASVCTDEGGRGGEPQAGCVNREHLTHRTKASDSRVSLQSKDGDKEERVEDEDGVREDGGAAAAGGGGGGGLQSCPMCLLVFPVGFTQMDCDGHLAQCLSEVNVDVTW